MCVSARGGSFFIRECSSLRSKRPQTATILAAGALPRAIQSHSFCESAGSPLRIRWGEDRRGPFPISPCRRSSTQAPPSIEQRHIEHGISNFLFSPRDPRHHPCLPVVLLPFLFLHITTISLLFLAVLFLAPSNTKTRQNPTLPSRGYWGLIGRSSGHSCSMHGLNSPICPKNLRFFGFEILCNLDPNQHGAPVQDRHKKHQRRNIQVSDSP